MRTVGNAYCELNLTCKARVEVSTKIYRGGFLICGCPPRYDVEKGKLLSVKGFRNRIGSESGCTYTQLRSA